jgi:large subunit ribosomal protein L5
MSAEETTSPRLLTRYKAEIIGQLQTEFKYKSVSQVPRVEKVVVNMGLGEAAANPKILEKAAEELGLITGQKPSIRRARTSVSNFKLREGQPIGAMVTLRGKRLWEFLDKAFDGRGNYTLGVREQIIFPEVNYDSVERVTGMNITVVTTAGTDAEGKALLTHLGMPFTQQG